MRFVFLAGGFAGFLLAGACSLSAGHDGNRTFLDAAVGCLAGAVLSRWLWARLLQGVIESRMHRAHSAAAAATTPIAKTK
ncbi:MAG: hypothetical protein JNK23_03145 [Opitutaceae bacterium]|nr:hypothetical protein [Opitutaceae bacterium]